MRGITMMQSNPPPMVPSHVFLGDIFDKGCLPINEPTMYCMVSLIHKENIIPHGMTFSILSVSGPLKYVNLRSAINNTGRVMYNKPKDTVLRNLRGRIFFINSTNSYQHPKWIKVNNMIKAQAFQRRPVSITTTNTTAVNALVLKV